MDKFAIKTSKHLEMIPVTNDAKEWT